MGPYLWLYAAVGDTLAIRDTDSLDHPPVCHSAAEDYKAAVLHNVGHRHQLQAIPCVWLVATVTAYVATALREVPA